MAEVNIAPIVLIESSEPVLGDRAVESARRQIRERNPQADIVELDAATYLSGQLAAYLSPSLFGEPKAIVVPNLEQVNDVFQDELISYIGAPETDSVVLLRHNGGQRGKKVLAALKKAKTPMYSIAKVKYPQEKIKLVQQDVRDCGRKITADAAGALVGALGSDLRELLASVAQLMADVPGTINESHVRTYFSGRVEATTFNVADAVVAGRAGNAVELARYALATGSSPVAIVSAIAVKLRSMAQVLGRRSGRVDTKVKMNEWQMKRAESALQGWNGETLAKAIQAIAKADAEVKGQSRDPEFALERSIVDICRLRENRRA